MNIEYMVDSNPQTISVNLLHANGEIENNDINRFGSTAINGFRPNDMHNNLNLHIKGKFYGNNAEYTAGTFQYDDGGGSLPTIEAKGVFKAKR